MDFVGFAGFVSVCVCVCVCVCGVCWVLMVYAGFIDFYIILIDFAGFAEFVCVMILPDFAIFLQILQKFVGFANLCVGFA